MTVLLTAVKKEAFAVTVEESDESVELIVVIEVSYDVFFVLIVVIEF